METIAKAIAVSLRRLKPKTVLGKRILAFIEKQGYSSLQEVADATRFHYQQLYDYATGRRVPRADKLEELVHALGGTMYEFYDPALLPKEN